MWIVTGYFRMGKKEQSDHYYRTTERKISSYNVLLCVFIFV